ncbi:hypothetical protein J4E80_006606 [Alternaria sp. BMP 0032]|nr:hypothetical protein J4E80_006606 [Alternaria sp. BMP 0032]
MKLGFTTHRISDQLHQSSHQLIGLSQKETFGIQSDLELLKMGQQQEQKENQRTERQDVLSGLDVKIGGLDVAIASLMAEQHTLKRAREYVLSTPDATSKSSGGNATSAYPGLKVPMRPTYPLPFHQARKAQSCLRQEVLIRDAMEREKSSSPPGSVGLLSSAEFESSFPAHNLPNGNEESDCSGSGADFGGKDDVRPSIERISSSTAGNHSVLSPTTTATPASRSSAPSPVSKTSAPGSKSRNGQGAHWQAKRVTKRKLQENAAKARAARMRKLKEMNLAAA